jgi:hypothetical protein
VRVLIYAVGCLVACSCSPEPYPAEHLGNSAQPLEPGVYRLESTVDDSCVEVAQAAVGNGADIQTGACVGGLHQLWRFIPRPDGSYRIRSLSSNKCMRAAGDINVQQGRCVYKRSKWLMVELGGGEIKLESVKTGRCASAAGSVEQKACTGSGSGAQVFRAVPLGPTNCTEGMTDTGTACMDTYEASHADATATSIGTSELAVSQPGVLPWYPLSTVVTEALSTARAACRRMGKRLCTLAEWVSSCQGPDALVYGYGNEYDPVICNSLDTYCYCDSAACSSLEVCPYPLCYSEPSPEGGGPCGAAFRATPTGFFPGCVNHYGVVDINGNVWELTDTNDLGAQRDGFPLLQ